MNYLRSLNLLINQCPPPSLGHMLVTRHSSCVIQYIFPPKGRVGADFSLRFHSALATPHSELPATLAIGFNVEEKAAKYKLKPKKRKKKK